MNADRKPLHLPAHAARSSASPGGRSANMPLDVATGGISATLVTEHNDKAVEGPVRRPEFHVIDCLEAAGPG